MRHDLTMQQVFEEIALQVARGDERAIRFVERLAEDKLRALLTANGIPARKKRGIKPSVSELDHESLYNLINEGDRTIDDDNIEELDVVSEVNNEKATG